MDNKEVADILKAAKLYLNKLKLLDTELDCAVKQIINTFEETERNIQETFSNLKETFINILNKRENSLLDEAKKIKRDSLTPLEECRNVILSKIEMTNKFINTGSSVINGNVDNLSKFAKDASLLGSLPEVPQLKEVPYLTFHYEPSSKTGIKNILIRFGEVCRIAPVQITELTEKPGAILVEWHCTEYEDRMNDIQEFRLQKAFGNVIKEKHLVVNFNDCYKGLDTQFLIRDLQIHQPYSFRISCKFEGSLEWSPWSLPQVSSTSLKPFAWEIHEDYTITNENKIAKPLKNTPMILYSDGPQFCVGHSIEFTFLEVDSTDAIIGLLSEDLRKTHTDLKTVTENSFLVNRYGKIFVNGMEKSTKFPEFIMGLKVCFTCDLVNNEKIRVNIDSNEKRVTYDWSIRQDSKLFFVSHFYSSNWKIMVE